MQLHMTGHPFIDIGLATLAVMSGKRRLGEVTQEDLRDVATRLKNWYSSNNVARNYISTVFTNSHFTQPSMTQEQREAYADRYLFAFLKDREAAADEPRCAFFPHLVAAEAAYRQHVPLLNGENIGNFSPFGHDGLPVSGLALLAIHALPFGCLKCGGRLLGFHQQSPGDNPDAARLMYALVNNIWNRNQRVLALPDEGKWQDFGGRAKLRYITEVISARQAIEMRGGEGKLDYISGYYFTNYGTGAEIEIIRLDHTIMEFIDRALLEIPSAWQRAVNANWIAGKKGELENKDEDRIANGRRNLLYERLFGLPNNALQFLSCLKKAADWKLIELFLREVMLMEQERINTYKKLGDLLSDYALKFENQPHSFYYAFSRARAYAALRGTIRTAAEKMYKVGADSLLFTYDDFVSAFEHPTERYSQWRLARDLISIRMLERLHQAKIDLSDLPDDEIDLNSPEAEEN